jgi:hypothetical protein
MDVVARSADLGIEHNSRELHVRHEDAAAPCVHVRLPRKVESGPEVVAKPGTALHT